jgi:dolichol-phosphate mannosyltransferase
MIYSTCSGKRPQKSGNLNKQFEIILVEDGSSDRSWAKIEDNCQRDPRIQGIRLSRNFGQHIAITECIYQALGEWVVVMDCDLQDRPEEIANLLAKAVQGYDIVLASRISRNDGVLKCFFSEFFYRILSFLSGTQYDSAVANFGIYHQKVIAAILRMPEKIRFFPAMVNWVGFNRTTMPVEHAMRLKGESSYNFKKQLKLAIDIILAYSDKPLRLIVGLGLFFSLVAFTLGGVILYRYMTGQINVLGYASLVTSICFFSGVIVSVLGVIGLYIGKIFDGIKNRPSYLITKQVNKRHG